MGADGSRRGSGPGREGLSPRLSDPARSIAHVDEVTTLPVARVAVDVPLAHLDRPFDYAVPDDLAALAVPGARVRVRFAGRLRDGFVLERVAHAEGERELAPLQRVISAEPVLHPAIARLVRSVADHYAGTFADVVRLAVPPRHGITENAVPPDHPAPLTGHVATTLPGYPGGQRFVEALTAGQRPRAAVTLAPVRHPLGDWAGALVDVAAAALAGGRGALLLVPDQRDLAHLAARCAQVFGKGSFVTLTADVGPAARYRAFLAASRGAVRLVLGTRAAAFTPVAGLGVIAGYDDGDDSYAEPRAPYPHARDVVALRAAEERCALVLVGYGRTAEVQALVARGWLASLELPGEGRRELCPVVRVAADTEAKLARDPAAHARLPRDVFETIRARVPGGPVLVQVPRAGYLAALACDECRAPALCPRCGHPLVGVREGGGARPACRWCGPQPGWRCLSCGSTRLRAPRVGVERTAEELGRAFPQTRVVSSSGDRLVDAVPDEPAIVLATPGAEPATPAGYAAAILLDGDVLLARADLRAGEEALRRWLTVTALVRPAADGGTVLVVAEPGARAVQALVRLDAVGFAERELADRVESGFPPGAKLVVVEGAPAAVGEVRQALQAVAADLLGPVPLTGAGEPQVRLTARSPLSEGKRLVAEAKLVQVARAAHKAEGVVRIRVDPQVLG